MAAPQMPSCGQNPSVPPGGNILSENDNDVYNVSNCDISEKTSNSNKDNNETDHSGELHNPQHS